MSDVYDPGHGGAATGALSPTRITRECDLVLDIGLASRDKSPDLILTRDSDRSQTFHQRNANATEAGAGLVISGHMDSVPGSTLRGLHAYHHRDNPRTEDLAELAVRYAPRELSGGRVICAHDNPWTDRDDWKRRAQHVTEAFDADVLLLEFGYLSHRRDLHYMRSTDGILACADLVVLLFQLYKGLSK